MERMAYLAPDEQDKIDAPDLEFIMSPEAAPGAISLDLPLADATHEFQAQYIKRHIDRQRGRHDGHRREAGSAAKQPVSQNEAAWDKQRRLGTRCPNWELIQVTSHSGTEAQRKGKVET